MDLVPPKTCFEWCRAHGIEPDTRYSEPRCLVYVPDRPHSRFWEVPPRAAEVPFFVSHLLAGLDPWSHCFLWPRGGRWPQPRRHDQVKDSVRDSLLRGAGVTPAFEGAVWYGRDELDRLIAVVFAHLVFGWSVTDDLFVLPDHGRQFLQTDHHDVVHVEFQDETLVNPFVKHMSTEEYPLPTDLPDATFRKSGWME